MSDPRVDLIHLCLVAPMPDGWGEPDPEDALDALVAERDRYQNALERIASGQSFTETAGIIDRSFSGLQAQAMMGLARAALAEVVAHPDAPDYARGEVGDYSG